ncbi:MAG: endonuclease/exonuclease/phosphatase family protein [Bacteroidales bacterium]|nr:endonuclease/exonuclease/phosphatase family protein [Bacteroidales bacterium]
MMAAIPVIPGAMDTMEKFAYEKDRNTHRIISANIRVALPDDDAAGNGWNVRKDICAQIIRKKNPDIICCQEVLKVQDQDMRNSFPGFGVFGFEGPEMDAFPEGYHGIAKNIIMYSKKRYEFISSGCYWLSETPLIAGSKSWDTARARHCNWMRLRDKNANREFRIINTHLDHVAQVAREKQVRMIMDESKQYREDFPQLFTGDFNSDAKNEVIKGMKAGGWTDTYAAIHGDVDPGPAVHGFKGPDSKPGRNGRIDFIFSKGPVKPLASEIIKDSVNGKYPSDHYFIYADVSF